MVVMLLPTAALTGSTHDRVGAPSRCTVHAPHNAIPQPYLVPVSPSVSRRTQSRGVSSATSTLSLLPLIVRLIIGHSPLNSCRARAAKNYTRRLLQAFLRDVPTP